jgi:hypothetical protein
MRPVELAVMQVSQENGSRGYPRHPNPTSSQTRHHVASPPPSRKRWAGRCSVADPALRWRGRDARRGKLARVRSGSEIGRDIGASRASPLDADVVQAPSGVGLRPTLVALATAALVAGAAVTPRVPLRKFFGPKQRSLEPRPGTPSTRPGIRRRRDFARIASPGGALRTAYI